MIEPTVVVQKIVIGTCHHSASVMRPSHSVLSRHRRRPVELLGSSREHPCVMTATNVQHLYVLSSVMRFCCLSALAQMTSETILTETVEYLVRKWHDNTVCSKPSVVREY